MIYTADSCIARIELRQIRRVWRRWILVVVGVEVLRGEVELVLEVDEREAPDEVASEMSGRWRDYVRVGSRISMRRQWPRVWRRRWLCA